MEHTQTHSDVDEMLNETEIGSLISKHKNAAIGVVVLALVGVIAYGVISNMQTKSQNKYNDSFYQFRKETLASFSEKKMSSTDLLAKFSAVSNEASGYVGLASLSLQVSDELQKQGFKKEALDLLNAQNASNAYLSYLIAVRKAGLYEDLGQLDQAIAELEKVTESKVKALEGKVYLDLGRLYLAQNNIEKAKVNLQYVVDNSKENEFIKLARLFLAQIK